MAELAPPQASLDRLVDQLEPVARERIALRDAAGRVLAEPIAADRDSPPMNVSAMDGYAVRLDALLQATDGTLPVAGEVAPGHAPPELPATHAMRIFTGGCVPDGADAVVPREDVHEQDDRVTLGIDPAKCKPGQHIRRRGENVVAGDRVLEAGVSLTPSAMAALSSFGVGRPVVHRRLNVAAIVTGDELLDADAAPQPWQIRDANGPALEAMFAPLPWVHWRGVKRVRDTPSELGDALEAAVAQSDVVLLTGGVSMGDYDHVPAAVEAAGGRIVFHKLSIRPGKPLLGAVGPAGQAILGLPGNPVSVLVTARRFAAAVARRRAGFARAEPPRPRVTLDNDDGRTLRLWWYRPVTLTDTGTARLVPTMGSGDVARIARSDGFVEQAPSEDSGEQSGEHARASLSFWSWTIDEPAAGQ